MSAKETTWEEIVAAERGQVFVDRFDDGIRFLIKRGRASLCAYVGVPIDHPLAGFGSDDIPLDCHGGLTFGDKGDGKFFPAGWWWYGWDYAHIGDRTTYDDDPRIRSVTMSFATNKETDKHWTPEMIESDAQSAIWDFQKLAKLAERIRSR